VNEGEKERFKLTPAVDILNIYRPEYPDKYPEYLNICPDYPAPPQTEQKLLD
jgi:hypothetical protein